MKKIGTLILAVFFTVAAFAQNADVTSAVLTYKKDQVAEAKGFIDKAFETYQEKNGEGVKEKVACKLFDYRGKIYLKLYSSKDEELKALVGEDALEIAVSSFKKLSEVDEKGKYKNDINRSLLACANAYENKGYLMLNKEELGRDAGPGDYKKALPVFERAFEIKQMEPLASAIKFDTTLVSNLAIIAKNGEEYGAAEKYYKQMLDLNFNKAAAYESLAEMFIQQKDNELAKKYLDAAKNDIGSNLKLIILEVNMYLGLGEEEKAVAPLLVAVEKDPENYAFQNALGDIYVQMGEYDKAIPRFEKAATLSPNENNPWYQLGFIDVQKANEWTKKAQGLGINEKTKFKEYNGKAKSFFESAAGNFEKALAASPDSYDTLRALKEVYYQLDMSEKLKEVMAKLKAMEG